MVLRRLYIGLLQGCVLRGFWFRTLCVFGFSRCLNLDLDSVCNGLVVKGADKDDEGSQ